MPFCRNCGGELSGSETFCPKCGAPQGAGTQAAATMPMSQAPIGTPPTVPYPVPVPTPSKHRTRNLLIVIAVVTVVVAAAAIALHRSSVLKIAVQSNHTSATVSYIVHVDGVQVDSGSLPAGYEVDLALSFDWWVDSCESHSVDASSAGGGTGPMADSALATLCSGTPASVTLRV